MPFIDFKALSNIVNLNNLYIIKVIFIPSIKVSEIPVTFYKLPKPQWLEASLSFRIPYQNQGFYLSPIAYVLVYGDVGISTIITNNRRQLQICTLSYWWNTFFQLGQKLRAWGGPPIEIWIWIGRDIWICT